MAAHGPFLGRLSNPVSPHVFPLIHVRNGLVVELEHTGPHASENHLNVPLEHHLSTPIWTASHSGCWVGAALLLAAVVVVVVVVECVCGWGGGRWWWTGRFTLFTASTPNFNFPNKHAVHSTNPSPTNQTYNDSNSTYEVKRNATLRWQYKIHKCACSG